MTGSLVAAALLLAPDRIVPAAGPENAGPDPGSILYAEDALSLRTVRGGMVVDLPGGRAVLVVELKGDEAILAPAPWDADLLRQYSEGRGHGRRARTFEDHLKARTRALLRFRDGILVAIGPPG